MALSVSDASTTTRATGPSGAPGHGLRVCLVTTSAGVGGTESQAALLVRSLKGAGATVDVTVLDGRGAAQDWGPGRVRVLRHGARRPAGGLREVAGLARDLAAGRYDVVHAVMARAHTLVPLVVSLLPRRRRPLVVAWRRNLGAHSGRRLPDLVERVAARRCDVLIANSAAVRSHWEARGHVPRLAFDVVPNALEDWRFDVVPAAHLDLAATHLVTVGNLREVKGHDVLLEAAALLRGRGLDVGVVVVGEGELAPRLRALAAEAAVPLRIVAGVRDPRALLRAADVYVHPSRSEGASNAVAEALAQGCRVVATDTGNARELLRDDRLLVPPGDPGALADAIARALAPADGNDPVSSDTVQQLGTARLVASHVKVYREGVTHVRHRRSG